MGQIQVSDLRLLTLVVLDEPLIGNIKRGMLKLLPCFPNCIGEPCLCLQWRVFQAYRAMLYSTVTWHCAVLPKYFTNSMSTRTDEKEITKLK